MRISFLLGLVLCFFSLSAQADWISVSADKASLNYTDLESAKFTVYINNKALKSNQRISVEGSYPSSSNSILLSGRGNVYSFNTALLSIGTPTFQVNAFLENAKQVDAYREKINEINEKLPNATTQERAELNRLKQILNEQISNARKLVETKKLNLTVVQGNLPPTPGSSQSFIMNEDGTLDFTLNSGTDREGAALSYNLVSGLSSGTLSGCLNGTGSLSCHFTPGLNYNGSIQLTYKAFDGVHYSSTSTISIQVNPVNDAPVIGADQNINGYEDTALNFNLNPAIDPDADQIYYSIVTQPAVGTILGCLDGGASRSCTYFPPANFSGEVSFTYRASDGILFTQTNAVVTLTINSVNDAPVLPPTQLFNGIEDQPLVINLAAASDIEGDSLIYSIATAPIHGQLINCLNGTNDLICDFIPEANFNGPLTFSYKANDGVLDSGISTVTINQEPVNDRPVAGSDIFLTMNENTSLEFSIPNGSDVDGDQITYRVVLPPIQGTLTGCLNDDSDLTCTFTPPSNFFGEVVFRYMVEDSFIGAEKLGSVTITVNTLNSKPIMPADINLAGVEDQELVFSLVSASDLNNDQLVYRLIEAPVGGELLGCLDDQNSLNCRFVPTGNFNGVVKFRYIAFDGKSDADNSTTVTMEIAKVNDRPIVGLDQNINLNKNTVSSFFLNKGFDVDDDTLTYHIVSAPLHGSVSGCLDGSSSLNCEYSPSLDFVGNDSLTYEVRDASSTSVNQGTISFRIAVANIAPRIGQISKAPSFVTLEDTVLEIILPGATDGNNDSLNYYIDVEPKNGKIGKCLNGTSDLTCEFTPDKNYNGNVSFSYFAFDGSLKSESLTVTIDVSAVNDPPVMPENQIFADAEGQVIAISLKRAIDVDTPNELITYSILSSPNVGVLGNCLTSTSDLECDYTPPDNFSGAVEFTYKAFDGVDNSIEFSKVTINISHVNKAPYFSKIQVAEIKPNIQSELVINPANDLDGDQITYELFQVPANIAISNCLNGTNDLVCDLNPATGFQGNVEILIRGFDGKVYSDVQKIRISVVDILIRNNIVAISTGNHHSCALIDNGNMKCWGINFFGQLGQGNTQMLGDDEYLNTVPELNLGEKIIQIATGGHHSCAVVESGKVKCWGFNSSGQLGLGHTNNMGDDELLNSIPFVQIGGTVTNISASIDFTCALLSNGTVKCWGANTVGQLGQSNTVQIGDNEHPSSISAINFGENVIDISAQGSAVCALLTSGKVKCWGGNNFGQLGLGHTNNIGDNESPTASPYVQVGENVTKIRNGDGHVCGILVSGKVKCWGLNTSGQLGQGNTTQIGDNEFPSTISALDFGSSVVDISTGSAYSCAVLQSGQLKCWGQNARGLLGLGHTNNMGDNESFSSIPFVDIGGISKKVSVRFSHSCTLFNDGKIKCWGQNDFGQLAQHNLITIGDNELPSSIGPIIFNGIAPVATFAFTPQLAKTFDDISFDSIGSSPGNSNSSIVSYNWDFGDGTTAEGAVVTHAFESSGNYAVRLIITDSDGFKAMFKDSVTVTMGPAPIAMISGSLDGPASLRVQFIGTGSLPSEFGATITSYSWDFGDGTFGNGEVLQHTYINPGVYTPKLTVTDSKRRKHTAQHVLIVYDSEPPTAIANLSSDQGRVPVTISFDANSSLPGSFDGVIVEYHWDFGDGAFGQGSVVNHTYLIVQNYVVRLTVKDNRGKSSFRDYNISVFPQSVPIAQISSSNNSGPVPLSLSFNGSQSLPSIENGSISRYEWDFGDGETLEGEQVLHTFSTQGDYLVKLKITDNVGKIASSSLMIHAEPLNPPVASFTINEDYIEGFVPVHLSLDASSSSSAGGPSLNQYIWEFSDGSTLSGMQVNKEINDPGDWTIRLKVVNSNGEYNVKTLHRTYKDALSISVTFAPGYPIFSSPTAAKIFVRDTLTLRAVVRDYTGEILDKAVEWVPSDPEMVSFELPGQSIEARMLKAGDVELRARIGNTYSQPIRVHVLDVNDEPNLRIGPTYFFSDYEPIIHGSSTYVNSILTSTFSSVPYIKVNSGQDFKANFSLNLGDNEVDLKLKRENENSIVERIRFFDGHGKSLHFQKNDLAQLKFSSGVIPSSFTLGFWTRVAAVSTNGNILKLSNTDGKELVFGFNNKRKLFFKIDASEKSYFLEGTTLVENDWQYVTVTFDSALKKFLLYQNGELVSERRIYSSLDWLAGPVAGTVGDSNFVGLFDEFLILSETISGNTLKQLMFKEIIPSSKIAELSFEENSQQVYFGNPSNTSEITLGTSTRFESEDPRLRKRSRVVASGVVSPEDGGVLVSSVVSSISLEVPSEAVKEIRTFSLQEFDAQTPGLLPSISGNTDRLIRITPPLINGFQKNVKLTVPINLKKYDQTGHVFLYEYNRSTYYLDTRYPLKVDRMKSLALFDLLKTGSYFISYDEIHPKVEYTDSEMREIFSPNGSYYQLNLKRNGTGPFIVSINGETENTEIKAITCGLGATSQSDSFPVVISGIGYGLTKCQFSFRRSIGEGKYVYLLNNINIQISTDEGI